ERRDLAGPVGYGASCTPAGGHLPLRLEDSAGRAALRRPFPEGVSEEAVEPSLDPRLVFFQLALPYEKDREAHRAMPPDCHRVAFSIRSELGEPERTISPGDRLQPVPLVVMPEAAVHENRPLVPAI